MVKVISNSKNKTRPYLQFFVVKTESSKKERGKNNNKHFIQKLWHINIAYNVDIQWLLLHNKFIKSKFKLIATVSNRLIEFMGFLLLLFMIAFWLRIIHHSSSRDVSNHFTNKHTQISWLSTKMLTNYDWVNTNFYCISFKRSQELEV